MHSPDVSSGALQFTPGKSDQGRSQKAAPLKQRDDLFQQLYHPQASLSPWRIPLLDAEKAKESDHAPSTKKAPGSTTLCLLLLLYLATGNFYS